MTPLAIGDAFEDNRPLPSAAHFDKLPRLEVDLDGIIVLVPMVPMVPELANEIERIRLEAGLSTEELLQSLREQRGRYNTEKYAKPAP